MVTFWHWAVHRSQGEWGTDVSFASLAPEYSAMGDEAVSYGGTQSKKAQQQLSLGKVFSDFDYGSLLKNPHGDIWPYFIQILNSRSVQMHFKHQGYPLDQLPYGTVI
jgi:hypothetical protein